MSPVTWRQGVTGPGWSSPSADGTRPHAVNKANYLLMAASWRQAGAGSPALGTFSKEQHCQALAQHHKATALELQSTLCLGDLLPQSAPACLFRAPLARAITEPPRRIVNGVWLAGAAWVSATPFPPYLPVPIGCSGLSSRALPPNDSRSHARSCLARHVASWALLPPLNLSLKTPSSVRSVPITRRCFAPTPAFPPLSSPPLPPGQDIPTWSCVPQAGWERPRSHRTAAWLDPLRMLQPGCPQTLDAREEPVGFSLASGGDLAVPTTSQTRAPQQHQLPFFFSAF